MPERWVCFDVNGTLLDPATLAGAWGEDAARARSLVFAALQEAVFAADVDTLTGEFRPLPELLGATLARRARLAGLDPARAEQAVALAREMEAYPDAAPALDALAHAGFRLAAVTNSAGEAARAALGHAGLLDRLAEVVGVDEIGRYKPHPDVYAHALNRLGAASGHAWFVAGHWWDVTGAKRAGLRTAWIAREERELLSCAAPPDVTAPDLLTAATRIAAA